MKTNLPSAGRWRLLLGLLVVVTSVAAGRTPDLSGDYADKGTSVPRELGQPPVEVSLHALLRAQLNPELGRTQYAESSSITLIDRGGIVDFKIYDAYDTLLQEGRWSRQHRGFTRDGVRLILRMRPPQGGDDAVVLVLEPLETGLLQVQVLEAHPTIFGIGHRALGTYLFHRTR